MRINASAETLCRQHWARSAGIARTVPMSANVLAASARMASSGDLRAAMASSSRRYFHAKKPNVPAAPRPVRRRKIQPAVTTSEEDDDDSSSDTTESDADSEYEDACESAQAALSRTHAMPLRQHV